MCLRRRLKYTVFYWAVWFLYAANIYPSNYMVDLLPIYSYLTLAQYETAILSRRAFGLGGVVSKLDDAEIAEKSSVVPQVVVEEPMS